MMQHAEVRERLELAALEPGGLDRLTAGDATDAALLAGHLAGCPSCLRELDRLRRSTAILRDVIAAEPSAELRERTLVLVRELGVPRGSAPAGGVAPAGGMAPAGGIGGVAIPTAIRPRSTQATLEEDPRAGHSDDVAASRPDARRRELRRRVAWVASIAAAVVLSVVATAALVGASANEEVAALAKVASWNVGIASAADGRHVPLQAAAGSPAGSARGELTFARSTGALVVVVKDLAAPTDGREYRCWLQARDGTRTRVGRMDFAGGISYWVGNVSALAAATPGTTFGIWLVDRGGDPAGAAVLVGEL
jgi:hypothetical protein